MSQLRALITTHWEPPTPEGLTPEEFAVAKRDHEQIMAISPAPEHMVHVLIKSPADVTMREQEPGFVRWAS